MWVKQSVCSIIKQSILQLMWGRRQILFKKCMLQQQQQLREMLPILTSAISSCSTDLLQRLPLTLLLLQRFLKELPPNCLCVFAAALRGAAGRRRMTIIMSPDFLLVCHHDCSLAYRAIIRVSTFCSLPLDTKSTHLMYQSLANAVWRPTKNNRSPSRPQTLLMLRPIMS